MLASESYLVDQINDAIVASDANYLLTAWNHAAEIMYGWSREEVIGKNGVDLLQTGLKGTKRWLETHAVPMSDKQGVIHPSFSEMARFYTPLSWKLLNKAVTNACEKEESYELDLEQVRTSGEIIHVTARGAPNYDASGKMIGLHGTVQDITERKLLEQELIKAKEQAEASDRLKSAFLSNMSHEIRTPMNGILGFTELLKDPDLSSAEKEQYIDIIETGGERLLNIINDIINISRIESGQMELSVVKTNINEQIEYLHNFFKPEAEQKGLKLKVRPPLPVHEAIIKTDPEKLYAIMTNLVKNALKFCNQGSIEFGYRVVEANHDPSQLEFFVRDTGKGIHPDQKEAIFERFIKGSDFLNKNRQGAGLGLSITKSYVEMLGGSIWVESELTKGSTFYFTIPNHRT